MSSLSLNQCVPVPATKALVPKQFGTDAYTISDWQTCLRVYHVMQPIHLKHTQNSSAEDREVLLRFRKFLLDPAALIYYTTGGISTTLYKRWAFDGGVPEKRTYSNDRFLHLILPFMLEVQEAARMETSQCEISRISNSFMSEEEVAAYFSRDLANEGRIFNSGEPYSSVSDIVPDDIEGVHTIPQPWGKILRYKGGNPFELREQPEDSTEVEPSHTSVSKDSKKSPAEKSLPGSKPQKPIGKLLAANKSGNRFLMPPPVQTFYSTERGCRTPPITDSTSAAEETDHPSTGGVKSPDHQNKPATRPQKRARIAHGGPRSPSPVATFESILKRWPVDREHS